METMNETLTIHYQRLSPEALSQEDRELVQRAVEAKASAYNPYSHFAVGAAARMADGRVVAGSNQENAAYPSGLCAERVALFSAGALCPGLAVKALAVTAAPCGACRQVMVETEQRGGGEMRILVLQPGGEICVFQSAKSLLPFGFEM